MNNVVGPVLLFGRADLAVGPANYKTVFHAVWPLAELARPARVN